jgi:hypothetical protein
VSGFVFLLANPEFYSHLASGYRGAPLREATVNPALSPVTLTCTYYPRKLKFRSIIIKQRLKQSINLCANRTCYISLVTRCWSRVLTENTIKQKDTFMSLPRDSNCWRVMLLFQCLRGSELWILSKKNSCQWKTCFQRFRFKRVERQTDMQTAGLRITTRQLAKGENVGL